MKKGGVSLRRPEPRPVSTLAGALWQEFEAIHNKPRPAAAHQGYHESLRAYYDAASQHDQAALCLSGGGIRSAAFSLGVLQTLARNGLLTQFDYLSTVSGGGYIGGWLTGLLHAQGGDAARVQDCLAAEEAPPELRALRGYTNFLSPRPGVMSPDTWAGIILWIRNAVINWLIFVPALFALALVPIFYADLITAVGPGCSWPLLLVALLCLGIGVYNGAVHLPSHSGAEPTLPARGARFGPMSVVAPLLAWAILVPLVAAPWLHAAMPYDAVLGDVIPPLGFVVMELAYVVAALRERGPHRALFERNFGWWTVGSLAATAILWLALDLGIARDPMLIAVLGPLVVTVAHLMQSLVYVALRKEALRGDLDREWLARLSGVKVLPSLLWAIFAFICLILPTLIFDRWSTVVHPFILSAIGLATGPVAAFLGKISKDVGTAGRSAANGGRMTLPLSILVSVITAVFAAALFMVLARIGTKLVEGGIWSDLILMAIAGLLALGLGRHVNVNRFSMHAVYRTRLVRAFLGSARRARQPDHFTGIDPRDNPRMTDVTAHAGARMALFPVINVTLNMTAGRNNAWNERKGESFTVTPVNCGAAYLQRMEDQAAGRPARGAYVRTSDYAGGEKETGRDDQGQGMTLGTALTLSGAAVSPNMGYHSSPATAFLMTLFNVRLGAWLPNPAIASTWELSRSKPPNALLTLGRELLGLTNDRGRAVYLSDGGHFENLGLYEMVRRRCTYILAIDADMDENAWFEDLGNAVRKIRIDLDIDIQFDPPMGIGSRDKPLTPFRSFAFATIHYPETTKTGKLIYVKPCDPTDIPMDVRSYRNAHIEFPHEPTVDQFYSESQFESYRQLGQSEAAVLVSGAGSLPAVFRTARQQLEPVALAARGPDML